MNQRHEHLKRLVRESDARREAEKQETPHRRADMSDSVVAVVHCLAPVEKRAKYRLPNGQTFETAGEMNAFIRGLMFYRDTIHAQVAHLIYHADIALAAGPKPIKQDQTERKKS